tara:strand:+ start:75 stop:437 length:363 start_codon:yes stop_codon:yes gene_type:complete
MKKPKPIGLANPRIGSITEEQIAKNKESVLDIEMSGLSYKPVGAFFKPSQYGTHVICPLCYSETVFYSAAFYSAECEYCKDVIMKEEWLSLRTISETEQYAAEQSPVEDGPKTYDEIHGV